MQAKCHQQEKPGHDSSDVPQSPVEESSPGPALPVAPVGHTLPVSVTVTSEQETVLRPPVIPPGSRTVISAEEISSIPAMPNSKRTGDIAIAYPHSKRQKLADSLFVMIGHHVQQDIVNPMEIVNFVLSLGPMSAVKWSPVSTDVLGLKEGILAGSDIFDAKHDNDKRGKTVNDLNHGKLDRIIMADKVGGTGFTLVGGNHTIFLGSLYSKDEEHQTIGAAPAKEPR